MRGNISDGRVLCFATGSSSNCARWPAGGGRPTFLQIQIPRWIREVRDFHKLETIDCCSVTVEVSRRIQRRAASGKASAKDCIVTLHHFLSPACERRALD